MAALRFLAAGFEFFKSYFFFGHIIVQIYQAAFAQKFLKLADVLFAGFYFQLFEEFAQLTQSDAIVFFLLFLQRFFDVVFGACRHHKVEPLGLRALFFAGNNFHLIAAFEHVLQWHQRQVYFGSQAVFSYLGVDVKGKVERGGAHRKFHHVAFGREGVDFFAVQVQFEVVEKVERVVFRILKLLFDFCQPMLHHIVFVAVFIFIKMMRSVSGFSNLVHALRTNLYFHPFSQVAHHGGVQGFVAIGFGYRNPVADAVVSGFVDFGDEGVNLPTVEPLSFRRRIQNNTDGKDVVHIFKRDILFLHLLPYRIDRFHPHMDHV